METERLAHDGKSEISHLDIHTQTNIANKCEHPQLPPVNIKNVKKCTKCPCKTQSLPPRLKSPPIIRITRSAPELPIIQYDDEKKGNSSSRYNDHYYKQTELSTKRRVFNVIINGIKQEFRVCELNTIKWFRKYLLLNTSSSGEISIEINDESQVFGMKELEVIIDCKQYKEILIDYEYDQIPKLLTALKFFNEQIDHKIFYQYLSNYFPVIDPSSSTLLEAVNECQNEEYSKAMIMYQKTYHYLGMKLTAKFINDWKTLPIQIISNMSNVSYLILLKTLKLIKIERDSRIRDPCQEWFDKDCILLIEFVKYRSWPDFEKLWKAVLNADNYDHILNLLTVVINQYLRRKDLEVWDSGKNHYSERIHYKHIEYPHDIGHLSKQMIKRVAYRIFYDKRKLASGLIDRFIQIIKKYMKITRMICEYNIIHIFYTKLVDKYFVAHTKFHPSIVILFNETYFDADIFQTGFDDILSEKQKKKFLKSIFTLSMTQNNDRFKRVYEYFMRINKHESFEYIVKYLSNTNLIPLTSFIPLVTTFKNILIMDKDKELLHKLDFILIDKYLLNTKKSSSKNKSLWPLIFAVCDESTIKEKFEKLEEERKVLFVKGLFETNDDEIGKNVKPKQIELAKGILDKNINIGLELFDIWFPILMNDEKEWIISTFMNVKWLSFSELEVILNVISDSLINNDKYDTIPMEYFEFVNKYTNIDT